MKYLCIWSYITIKNCIKPLSSKTKIIPLSLSLPQPLSDSDHLDSHQPILRYRGVLLFLQAVHSQGHLLHLSPQRVHSCGHFASDLHYPDLSESNSIIYIISQPVWIQKKQTPSINVHTNLIAQTEQGVISEDAIDKAVHLGWYVIGLIVALFFLNIVLAVGIEYPNIKAFILKLIEKLRSKGFV